MFAVSAYCVNEEAGAAVVSGTCIDATHSQTLHAHKATEQQVKESGCVIFIPEGLTTDPEEA